MPHDLAKALHKRPFTNISTKRLPHTNQTMLLLEHQSLIITVLINHRGQVCEVNEFPQLNPDQMAATQGSRKLDTVLCDHHGQVYKVNDLQTANYGANEGKVDIKFKQ